MPIFFSDSVFGHPVVVQFLLNGWCSPFLLLVSFSLLLLSYIFYFLLSLYPGHPFFSLSYTLIHYYIPNTRNPNILHCCLYTLLFVSPLLVPTDPPTYSTPSWRLFSRNSPSPLFSQSPTPFNHTVLLAQLASHRTLYRHGTLLSPNQPYIIAKCANVSAYPNSKTGPPSHSLTCYVDFPFFFLLSSLPVLPYHVQLRE